MEIAVDNYEVKGFCPTPLNPIISGDGLLARIYPKLGLLSSSQIFDLSKIVAEYGNGEINLSNRSGLQIRGLSETNYSAFLNRLIDIQLVKNGQTFFNITTTPFWSDKEKYLDIYEQTQQYLSRLVELPDKYSVSIDLENSTSLNGISSDIRVEKYSENQFLVRADGDDKGFLAPLNEVPKLIYQIAEWFLNSGGANLKGGRMKSHILSGVDVPKFTSKRVPPEKKVFIPKLGKTKIGLLTAVAFGEISTSLLLDIFKYQANIRLTPWRMILIEGLNDIQISELIVDPKDPLLKFSACVGRPRCLQAKSDVRQLARSVANNLEQPLGAKYYSHNEALSFHFSGCSKGCAYPTKADVTIVGADIKTYNIIYDGSAYDEPKLCGIKEDDIIANSSDYLKVLNDT